MRWSLWFVVVASLVALGPRCDDREKPTPQSAASFVVRGTVRASPPPTDMPSLQVPPEGAMVAGALVMLRGFRGEDQPAGPVVAATLTDSLGAYRLSAPAGTYFLLVAKAPVPHAVFTTGYRGANFAPGDSVNVSQVIHLKADTDVHLVVPQAWPR